MILLFMPFHALSIADIFNIFQLNFKYLTGDQILKTFLIFICSFGFLFISIHKFSSKKFRFFITNFLSFFNSFLYLLPESN